MNCPDCKNEMTQEKWTLDLDICTCNNCKIKRYYSNKLNRFLTDSEINETIDDWQ